MNVRHGPLAVALAASIIAGSCATASERPSPSGSEPTPSVTAAAVRPDGSVVIVGRVVTMAEPAIAEAVFIRAGTVAAVGARQEVLAAAGDGVPVIDLGDSVAYPGFIDAHAHWIGDREYYAIDSPEAAIEAAVSRGWTSISEQWVNPERLDELSGLAAAGALPVRVDAYLALNYDDEFLGDWYEDREPGAVDDVLRVRGVKIHLDDGWGHTINWEEADLTATIGRANAAGWQVSVHAMSAAAMELVLDAFGAALGPGGPNPLHHRIEHAMQVTDEQLARLVAMDIAIVTHADGASDWLLDDRVVAAFDRDAPGAQLPLLNRWRDLVDAGLHVAWATDAPWTFPDSTLTDTMGRPVDQVATGMDGRLRTRGATPPWAPGQLLTGEQGLRGVTIDAAWALGDEDRRGHLAPGTLGDVTILSGDITSGTPDEIRARRVVGTIVGGVVVSCSDAAVCGGG